MLSLSLFFAAMWAPLAGMWGLALLLTIVALRCATPARYRALQVLKIAGGALMFGYFFGRVVVGLPEVVGSEEWLWLRNIASAVLALGAVWESLARVRRAVDLRRGITRRARMRRLEVHHE